MNTELLYQLALTEVPHIGYVQAKILNDQFGSASAIFNASQKQLERLERMGEVRARSIKSFRDFSGARKEIEFINRYGIKTLYLSDKDYPQRLLNCDDPPTILFYKGNADLNTSRMVAIVGTRNNTDYGKTMTEKLVKKLASCNCIVVSGLAFGIDSIAHKFAIKNHVPTLGVLGHGLDTIYPRENSQLARQMIKEGGLLTEFRSRTKPDKYNFPSRNRIVAGLTDATIIIESGIKGGSIITADLANGYHRDVFAIPGRSIDAKSGGCNDLIRNNKAVLLQDPGQFIETMGWAEERKIHSAVQREMFIELSGEEKRIAELLKENENLGIDELNFRSGISSGSLAATLLNLELRGFLKVLPGKRYKLSDA